MTRLKRSAMMDVGLTHFRAGAGVSPCRSDWLTSQPRRDAQETGQSSCVSPEV